jgi:hypothetical protein
MTEKKNPRRSKSPRKDALIEHRRRVHEAEQQLTPLGSERVYLDAECYDLIANLVLRYRIRKQEVLRKALRVGLQALVLPGRLDHSLDFVSRVHDVKDKVLSLQGLQGSVDPHEVPEDGKHMEQQEQTVAYWRDRELVETASTILQADLDPEAAAVAAGV